jgi:lectin-like protein
VLALCLSAACTPLRDLSSYSDAPVPSAGAGNEARAAVVSSPNEPAEAAVPLASSEAADADTPNAPTVAASAETASSDAGTSSASLPCNGPGEVAAERGRCYSFATESLDWLGASAACVAWGGALARIESSEREASLLENASGDSWLGLNDRESEGDMRWDGAAELGSYANWAAQQPDDFDGSEDCVELLADGRGWNDRPCTDLRAYVCER